MGEKGKTGTGETVERPPGEVAVEVSGTTVGTGSDQPPPAPGEKGTGQS
jgi:hypothetical protein